MKLLAQIRSGFSSPMGYREICRVGLPLVASMGSSTVMQFTDRLFLSKYSVEAIAAAVPATVASLTVMLALMGLSGYSTVLIAQYVGSGKFHRVGSALWQGVWCSLLAGILLCSMWWLAKPLFAYAGHEPVIQEMEVAYFRILTIGSIFALLGASLGGFYAGQGITRLVMIANMLAAVINIPLDYLLIFGGLGIPSLGIVGAGIATVFGWFFCFVFLARCIFTKANEERFKVISSWRFQWDMFKRLLRFGFPSGVNLFAELFSSTWFVFEVGSLGKIPLAATNIAFSINSLVFIPMLGLNMAVSALVGQAMGRQRPDEAEEVTRYTLHLVFAYMAPLALCFVLFPQFLMGLFAPANLTPEQFLPVKEVGVVLLYFIAAYSLIDSANIVYFGALKGAGDTPGIMRLIVSATLFILIAPIMILKHIGITDVYAYWVVFTIFVMLLAVCVHIRFWRGKWHSISVIER